MLLKTYAGRFRLTDGGSVAAGVTQLHSARAHAGPQRLSVRIQPARRWSSGATPFTCRKYRCPRPIVTSEYDISEPMAAESRQRTFEYVASERLLVTGGHVHLPGFAHVVPSGSGFRLVPEPWAVDI